ncbi:MAG TPA: hypothetical protein VMA72_27130 [Streptosporangiaceae bacterium]|nr:hypothetical protein [Streptosporangiaceae bacterium]
MRHADDEAAPGGIALGYEPVAHMCVHNGSPPLSIVVVSPACPAGSVAGSGHTASVAGTFATSGCAFRRRDEGP